METVEDVKAALQRLDGIYKLELFGDGSGGVYTLDGSEEKVVRSFYDEPLVPVIESIRADVEPGTEVTLNDGLPAWVFPGRNCLWVVVPFDPGWELFEYSSGGSALDTRLTDRHDGSWDIDW